MLAVAVPTVGLLFFMSRALDGERERLLREQLSGRQRSLEEARAGVEAELRRRTEAPAPTDGVARKRFVQAMERGIADGCAVLDEHGALAFPLLTEADDDEADEDEGEGAADNESTPDPLATFAWSRIKSGRLPDADALATLAADYGSSRLSGRAVADYARLAALRRAPRAEPRFRELAEALRTTVLAEDARIPSAQRLFIADELERLGVTVGLPFAEAERRSLQLAESVPLPTEPGVLRAAGGDAFQTLSADRGLVLYFDAVKLRASLAGALSVPASGGLTLRLRSHDESRASEGEAPTAPLATVSIGPRLPEWEIAAFGEDAARAIAAQSLRLKRAYLWSAIGGALGIGLLAAWAIRRLATRVRDNRVRHDFLSTVSHELKTPLASIRMFVDTLAHDGVADAERTQSYLQHISRENDRLSRLVENFLTFSRIESGRLAFDFQPVHPGEIVAAACEAVATRMDVPGCEFTVEVAPGLPWIDADLGSLVTALVNLLDNAAKYTREDKRIFLGVSRENDSVAFSVADNGLGLAPEVLRRLGEKFYRVRPHERQGREGFGLGLSIVRSIVEAHRGKLEIAGEPGVGSRFTLRLPMASEQPPPEEEEKAVPMNFHP